MIRKLPVLAALAAASIAFAGCETTPADTGAYLPLNTTVNDLENHEPVVLLDPRVQTSVTCNGIYTKTLPDGRLDVVANIRNREGRRIQVQINCVYKDDLGAPTEGEETPFRTLILTENAQEPVHFVSLNDKARRFTIRIREAH